MNLKAIDELLTIDHPHEETVHGVIGRMESSFELIKSIENLNHLLPFAFAYKEVTKSVLNHVLVSEYFYSNYKSMELLDVVFAKSYFEPLKLFLKSGHSLAPWDSYYDFCMTGKDIPFLQMFLGIQVHINGDLPIALYQSQYFNFEDYNKVNIVLEEILIQLMGYLAFSEKDFVGFGGLVLRKLYIKEFSKIIVRWRKESWDRALKLRTMNKKHERDIFIAKIHSRTNSLTLEIASIWEEYFYVFGIPKLLTELDKISLNTD